MFNAGQFNQIAFNPGVPKINEVPCAAVFTTKTHTRAALVSRRSLHAAMGTSVGAAASGASGIALEAAAHSALQYGGGLRRMLYTRARMAADFSACARGSRMYRPSVQIRAEVQGRATGCRRLHCIDRMTGETAQRARLARKIRAVNAQFEAQFEAQVSDVQLEISYLTLALTLAPGQSIVIDGDLYTVERDGANVLDAFAGDFPLLSRETYDIVVEGTGAAQIEKRIRYTERWE